MRKNLEKEREERKKIWENTTKNKQKYGEDMKKRKKGNIWENA